jgi:hypothetical protein
MSPASSYLRSRDSGRLSPEELAEFIRLLSGETRPEDQPASVEYFLLATSPLPDQLLTLAKSEVARRSLGVQILLKRYVRGQEYQASEARAKKEEASKWAPVRDFLLTLSSLS